MTITIFGAGTLGGRVARFTQCATWAVTQGESRHAQLRSATVTPTTTWPPVTPETRVVLCMPGSTVQGAAITRLQSQARPARAVLVSTIGYHAPYRGSIYPRSPPGEGERTRIAARTEAAFTEWIGSDGVIVRLGGLWHASRGPLAAFRRTGTARLGPPDSPLPLIHYDDAARLVWAVLMHDTPPPVVLGVTEQPDRETFYRSAANAFGHPVPPFTREHGSTAHIHDPVGVALMAPLEHPDWRAALQSH